MAHSPAPLPPAPAIQPLDGCSIAHQTVAAGDVGPGSARPPRPFRSLPDGTPPPAATTASAHRAARATVDSPSCVVRACASSRGRPLCSCAWLCVWRQSARPGCLAGWAGGRLSGCVGCARPSLGDTCSLSERLMQTGGAGGCVERATGGGGTQSRWWAWRRGVSGPFSQDEGILPRRSLCGGSQCWNLGWVFSEWL
jgi:hypothetical protein